MLGHPEPAVPTHALGFAEEPSVAKVRYKGKEKEKETTTKNGLAKVHGVVETMPGSWHEGVLLDRGRYYIFTLKGRSSVCLVRRRSGISE